MIEEIEIWKPVVGFEGRYEVSSLGRIRTLERKYLSGEHRNIIKTVVPGLLFVKNNSSGYGQVKFTKDGKRYFRKVSRVVCEAFHPNPENKPQVNHINGIRDDDRSENLEWSTDYENKVHSYRVLKRRISGSAAIPKFGVDNPASRKVAKLTLSGDVVNEYACMADAEKEGFSKSKICLVAQGQRQTHGGYKWQYI